MKIIKYFSLVLFLATTTIVAQQRTVTGLVVDTDTNEPLLGASVVVKGTANGTTTDFDGMFTLSDVSSDDILQVSYIGFVALEYAVGDADNLTIGLKEDVAALDEVIVIGYGTQTRKEITGAVTVVGAKTIEQLKPTQVEQALQGQVAGVNVTAQSGSPGSPSDIRIRGISTNGDNRPLILLDGNVIEDLSVVNPGDIESINVLKDATAGIYGVRAANGVVLITTKTGRKATPLRITYDAFGGFQQTTRRLPVLNATEYAIIKNEAAAAVGDALPYPDISTLGAGTDWQNEVFQNAPIINQSLNLSGGTQKATYAFVASTLNQDGIVGGSQSGFQRYNTRLNLTYDILENLKFRGNFIYTNTKRKTLSETGLGSVLFNALNMAPTLTPRQADGSYTLAVGHPIEVINPLAQIENTFNQSQTDKLSGVLGLSYTFLDNFTFTSNFQWNYAEVRYKEFRPILDFGDPGFNTVFDNANATYTENLEYYRDYTFDNFIDYSNTFGEDHNLKVTLGTSVFKTVGDLFSGTYNQNVTGTSLSDVGGFTPGQYDQVAYQPTDWPASRLVFDSRLLSYFTRIQYDYKGKYLFSGVLRRDGSSKFGPENKFGYFPSGSVGWVVSDEGFFGSPDWFNFLKLRGSYGIIGNDRIADNQFVSLLDGEGAYVVNGNLVFGSALGTAANPEIQWEEQTTLDIGFDAKFLNNKINLTTDYFRRTTDNLLLEVPTSGLLGTDAPGAGNPTANAGSVRNSGFEFVIGYNDAVSSDFSLNTSFNFTYLKNEVLSVNNGIGFVEGGEFGIGQLPPSRMEAGQPLGYFYGYQTDGVFQNQAEVDAHPSQLALGAEASPGDFRFRDINGDGVIDPDDRTYLGDPIPDFTMGLNLGFDYKNVDFKAYFFASLGNDIVRNYERNDAITNQSVYTLNRWTGEGSTNSNPRVTNGATSNIVFSDYFVEDGSFLRAQNMQLGYTFPSETMDKLGVKSLRFYLSVNNLFTLTKYRGFDPSASTGAPIGGGIDPGFYPLPRTYMLGANFKL